MFVEGFNVYGYIYEPYALNPGLLSKLNKITSRQPGDVQMMDCFHYISKAEIIRKYPGNMF